MKNGWTGGQYSIFRSLLGLYLFQHFLTLLPWGAEVFSNRGALPDASASPLVHLFPNVLAVLDHPQFVSFLLLLGAFLSGLLVVGCWDRPAAIALWYLLACLFGRNPLISNPALPFIGWLLLLHTVLPKAPYGGWSARGRNDVGGNWHMPESVFALAWILMAAAYSYSGYTKLVSPSWLDGSAFARVLENPLARPTSLRAWLLGLPVSLRLATWSALILELTFAPLALFRRARPWIWTAMVGLHAGLLALVSFADLTAGMLLVHLFTFDPAWIRQKTADNAEWIFYDGTCALCHQWVRFVLAEDINGKAFRISPLQGALIATRFPAEKRASLPDSLILLTEDARLLTRSAAVLHVLRRMGGLWRIVAGILVVIPRSVLDWGYDRVANVRKQIFGTRENLCPVLSPELRRRFDA
jgi:predicted DCC family thiol-disulfide oxidoreductase YuxK